MNARSLGRPAFAALALVVAAWALQPERAAAQGPPPGAGPVVLEGELDVVYEDDDVNGRLLHFLNMESRRIPLRFANGTAPDIPTGSRVRVAGNLADGEVTATSITTLAVSATRTFGPQNVLVILFNFSTNTTQPFSATTIASINDQVKNFYLESTYGQTVLSFTVMGWFTIEATTTTCDYTTWGTQAEAAAISAGFNTAAYDRLVFAFPRVSACSWTGAGNVAGPRSWLNGSFTLRTFAHEQGHNFGNYHSKALKCDSSACTTVEYGDDRDVLGASGVVGHMNAFQKERLGWLNYGSSPTIQTVTTSGEYFIENYETIRGASKALKIWNSAASSYYYVESRAKTGFDANVPAGVTLHSAASGASTGYQIDLAPTTTTWDSTLDPAQTFTDQAMGLSITTVSNSIDGALVRVSFGPLACTTATPSVTLSPSSQTRTAGSVMSFTVNVTNKDGAGCAPAPFTLAAAAPSGWPAYFSAFPTLAPGASAAVTLSITIPADASGTNTFTVTARNTNSGAASSASGSVVVSTPVTSLTVAASAAVSGGKNNRTITVTVTVKAGSVSASGAAVSVTVQPPGGGSPTALSATTAGNGRATVKYSVPPQLSGEYQVQAVASLSGITGSGSTSVTVQ